MNNGIILYVFILGIVYLFDCYLNFKFIIFMVVKVFAYVAKL